MGNNGVGPVVHAIGKREAEAEADPAVLYAGAYGGYYGGLYGGLRGYGYGYGLGHAYGLGYGHRLGYYGHHAGAVQAGAFTLTDGPMDPTTESDPLSTLLAKGRLRPKLTPLFCTLVPMEVTMVVFMEV